MEFKGETYSQYEITKMRVTSLLNVKSLSLRKKMFIMSRTMRNLSYISTVAMLLVFSACKNKDPSVLKVFVRSSNNELMQNAKVIIIADVNSNPATAAYVDTVQTNSSGFAYFEMDEFFDDVSNGETTGYFDIVAKKDVSQGSGYVHCRAHITSVETVYLAP